MDLILSTRTECSLTDICQFGLLETHRASLVKQLHKNELFDVAIVGGGATGVGIALEAASRGFSTVLLEACDFAKGTSSRATKLVHGGVRYLAQGNFSLVREALRERKYFFNNAPHLAQPLGFVMPTYQRRDLVLYGLGLSLYDAIAGRASVGRTSFLSKQELQAAAPTLQDDGLKGGIRYWDGQFDDARMVLAIARSAAARGAVLLNYFAVTSLVENQGQLQGLKCRDQETGVEYEIAAKCVVNATGVWSDAIKALDRGDPASKVAALVQPSQGTHLVVDRSFWPSHDALIIPQTVDGRVLFAIPWLGATLLGTTDSARSDVPHEPKPTAVEVDFILGELTPYLKKPPTRSDVKSAWAGLRPLAHKPASHSRSTSSISREHSIEVSRSGLVSVTGGKWTTYRLMAEQVIAESIKAGLLQPRAGSTINLPLIGATTEKTIPISASAGYHLYGSEREIVSSLPGGDQWLAPSLSEAMVRFGARYEYARTVEDILARRSRLLFLDAYAARSVAPYVCAILQQELNIDPKLKQFEELCSQYSLESLETV